MKEELIQKLIADFPWILNLNYENVPELVQKGMEYVTSGQKRVDLILRDRITKRPILVEFKSVPFYRENIGQILEYRTRTLLELINENSILNKVFNEQIVSPILILVVPTCSVESRLACNLSGIEIFEYEKDTKKFTEPNIRAKLEETTKYLSDTVLPISDERHSRIEEINENILKVLSKYNCEYAYKKFKYPPGSYYYSLANLFVNKWLFYENEISIGIYEDIFQDHFDEIAIEYFSENIIKLEQLRKKMIDKNFEKKIPELVEKKSEAYLTFYESKKEFIENVNILEPYLKIYLDLISL